MSDGTTWTDDGSDDDRQRLAPPSLIAGRYRPGAILGGGAFGQVHEAEDVTSGARVAIKLFAAECDPARIRREIGVLRLLRVPGVVRLLDEGRHGRLPYLVMERVDGRPFPGVGIPIGWDVLAPRAIALLETLAHVHPAGIVHRDLKPANVLVDSDGNPTVVDFGISSVASMARALTQQGEILGTPAYLAPEQIRGESAGPATDLYAVGVMLYEALTGSLPHRGPSLAAMFYDRLHHVPRSLSAVAPDVPARVARVIDQLLAIDAGERPRSADAVLALLASDAASPSVRLPWLGCPEVIDAAVAALGAGGSFLVTGPRGSGRSRVLEEIEERWRARGRPVVRARPGTMPFESLEPVVGSLDGLADAPLAVVEGEVAARLDRLHGDGIVVVADDVERCDARTRRLLERVAARGGVVRAGLASEQAPIADRVLADASLAELAALFLGPERLFHRQSDAARTLHARTGGRPARIAAEVTRWTRQGIASWVGARLAVDQARLDELDARPVILAAASADVAVPADLLDLVSWLVVAGPGVDVAVLARATGWRHYQVEGRLEEMESRGLVPRTGGHVALTGHLLDAVPWSPARIRAAHQALAAALPHASQRRLFHLLAALDPDAPVPTEAIADETLALARREVEDGRVTRATTWLADGLAAVRRAAESSAERTLLAEWVRVALLAGTTSALDQVLAEIARAHVDVADLEVLARAALAALAADGERALSLIDAVPSFADPALELERQAARVSAARRGDLAGERRVVESAAAWASARGDRDAEARASAWLGRLRYRERRFDDAARLHHAAAASARLAVVRVTAWLDAAEAEIWDLRCDDAIRDAARARAEAATYRFVLHEARAEWLLRYASYRDGSAIVHDGELVELAAAVGVPELEAQICLTEAAIAWRADDRAAGARLAQHAAELWRGLSMRTPSATAQSLAAACRGELDDATWRRLHDAAATAWDPWIGLQIAGLACLAAPARAAEAAPLLLALAAQSPPRDWSARLDVLSLGECFRAVGLAPPAVIEVPARVAPELRP